MKAPSRRALLGFGAASVGLAALETLALRGEFDNRRILPATALERYRASLEAVTRAGATEASLVHVGHSTHLLCVAGLRLLTDPWFSDPAFGALAHSRGPAVDVENLGPIDALLISHDHPDHADLGALDRVADKTRAAVLMNSRGLAARFRSHGFSNVHVLGEWERFSLGSLVIQTTPALHDIAEIGFVIESAAHRIYFAGDTRLFEAHYAIAERVKPTAAILPVDGTRIRTGGVWVMSPEDAVEAARRLGVRHVFPSHAEAVFCDPVVEIALATTVSNAPARFRDLVSHALPHVRCDLPAPGERVLL